VRCPWAPPTAPGPLLLPLGPSYCPCEPLPLLVGGFAVTHPVRPLQVGALVQALEGKYVEPGPGGDPIRNPSVLPTGKNIHALDPQSIPTQVCPGGTALKD
jgi:hypothetical protein